MLTQLRPRLAFGVAGVSPEPQWKTRLLNANPERDPQGNLAFPGVTLFTLGNTQLHPERSREIEGGFDAELWGGRANMTVSGYDKLRTDAIQQVMTASSIYGGVPLYLNVGRIRNSGVEMTVDARPIETGMLAWGVGGTIGANRNKLVTLYGDQPYIPLEAGQRLAAGYPVDGIWVRRIAGYNDMDGDGRLGIADIAIDDSAVYVGSSLPRFELPFHTNVSLWHGALGIYANFNYKSGVTQYNSGISQQLVNLYQNPGATLTEQAIALASGGAVLLAGSGATDAGLIQTVSTLRFDDLSLNYAVPQSLSRCAGVRRMTVALQGKNLGLWTNYRGKDPDVNGNTLGELLTDPGVAPPPRTWTLRITLGN